MEKEMEKAKNIIDMVNYYLMENFQIEKYRTEKYIIEMVVQNMKLEMEKDI